MEHAQRALVVRLQGNSATGLNPYFNGTCSKSACARCCLSALMYCLNPYFNGTCSKSENRFSMKTLFYLVLILILMEHAQRDP